MLFVVWFRFILLKELNFPTQESSFHRMSALFNISAKQTRARVLPLAIQPVLDVSNRTTLYNMYLSCISQAFVVGYL